MKAGHIGELGRQFSQCSSICVIGSTRAVTLDLQQDCSDAGDISPVEVLEWNDQPIQDQVDAFRTPLFCLYYCPLGQIAAPCRSGALSRDDKAPRRLRHPQDESAWYQSRNPPIVVARWHPRDKQTRVGARNDVVDVKPDTVNMSGKVGVTSGLGSSIVIVVLLIILLLVVYMLFVGVLIVLRVVLNIPRDGVQQRALFEA